MNFFSLLVVDILWVKTGGKLPFLRFKNFIGLYNKIIPYEKTIILYCNSNPDC